MSARGWLIATAILGTSAARTVAVFDADAALAKAHRLIPHVVRNEPGPLWAEFDDAMRGGLRDSAGFVVTLDEPRNEYPSPHLDYRTKTSLHLPFADEWTVFWGGRTLATNYHAFTRDQRFAVDLLIVKDGRTHRGDGTRCSDYYCYGRPVLAPAAGIMVWERDSLPDQPPGRMDPSQATGNSLILDHGNGEYSLLAHLQPGSLRFRTGERVPAGAEVGRCGNSGNTSEPHLHYHLQDGPRPFVADGLPVQFVDVMVDGERVARAEPEKGQRVRTATLTAPARPRR